MKDARCETCARLFAKQVEMGKRRYAAEDENKRELLAYHLSKIENNLYDHVRASHGDEWENGRDFMRRWRFPKEVMCERVLPELPLYVFTVGGVLKPGLEAAAEWPGGLSLSFPHPFDSTQDELCNVFETIVQRASVTLILDKPINWWFKRREVEFFETCHSDICQAGQDRQSPWLTPVGLAQEWGITSETLLMFVREKGLPAWILNKKAGLLRVWSERVQDYGLGNALLDKSDAEDFLKKHPTLYGYKKKESKDRRRVEEDPNFKPAIDFAKRVKHEYSRINMDDLAFITHAVLTYGDRPFDNDLLERNYARVRELPRQGFTGKRKPKESTVRNWFRRPEAFPRGKS